MATEFYKKTKDLEAIYFKECSEYTRFVRGRSIAIVGPSSDMLDSNLGEEIDGHDLVVRLNTAIYNFDKIHKIAKDVGAKTDILYLGNHIIRETKNKNNFYKNLLSKDIKFLVAASPSGNYNWQNLTEYLKNKTSSLSVKYSESSDTSFFIREYLSSSKVPFARVGFVSIVDLLLRGPKSISIYGMTFYNKGGNIFRDDAIQDITPTSNHLGERIVRHDSNLELLFFKKIYNIYKNKIKKTNSVLKLL